MAVVSMKALLETGVHFGHRTQRWHPRMKEYIFTERNGVHIIDLQQTITALERCSEIVTDLVAGGGNVLFVGTKRQAQPAIREEAERCGMPYVSERWLGGTLTNWSTIRRRIEYLLSLEARRDSGEFERLTKKEALDLSRQIDKLNVRLGGIREMRRLPDMLFIVDIQRETTAVREANRLGIPIMAVVDTNCDPNPIDYVIPANDDAIRAIRLMASLVADAVMKGAAQRKELEPEEPETEEIGLEDEKYLSAATLARLKELSLGEGDESFDEFDEVEFEDTTAEIEPEVVAAEEASTEPAAAEVAARASKKAEPRVRAEAPAETEEKPKKKTKPKATKKAEAEEVKPKAEPKKAEVEAEAETAVEKKAKPKAKAAAPVEEEAKPKKKVAKKAEDTEAKPKAKSKKKAEAEVEADAKAEKKPKAKATKKADTKAEKKTKAKTAEDEKKTKAKSKKTTKSKKS